MPPTLSNHRPLAASLFSCFAPAPGRVLRVLLLGLLLSSPLHLWAQTTLYVSTTGTNSSPASATSWATSTTDLQGAIDAAAPGSGTVYVAAGLYQPGGSGNTIRATSFSIASGVRVLGGYDGSGTPGNRTAFPSSSTLTGGNQSYHVVWMQNVAVGTTLDGFVITGGLANGSSSPDNQGGGIFSWAQSGSSSPTLQNLVITGNTAQDGGGIYTSGNSHSLTATNLLLRSNTATATNASIGGGGLYARGGSSNLSSLTVTANSAKNGGGIYTQSSHTLIAANSLLQGNIATREGGGLYATNGSSNLSSLTVTANTTGFNGGGIYTSGTLHSLTATNSLLQSNIAATNGGGLFASGGSSNLSSLTVTANRAANGGGINTSSHTLVAVNSLLQSNTATDGGGGLRADGGSSNLSSLTVTANRAGLGGGIYTDLHTLTATTSLLQSNTATNSSFGGGGLFASRGGSSNLSSLTVTANTAPAGGGIYTQNSHSLTATNSLLQSNTATTNGGGLFASDALSRVVNSLLEGNAATSSGGAAYVEGSSSSLTLTNATLRTNTAPQGAGIRTASSGLATLVNTLLWGNGPAANAISASPAVQATFSLFETGTTGFTSDPTNITTATSPFAGANGPALAATSEAIDAGLNTAPDLALVTTDLLGQARVTNCSVDLGAVESQGSATVVITTQPAASSAVCAGLPVSVSVVARGSNLSYQWYRNGVSVPGQTSAVLSFTAVTANDAGSYSVVVTRACPTVVTSVTSTVFSLSVNLASVTLTVAPIVNASPGSATLTCAQTSLTLTAATSSAGSFAYAFAGTGLSSPNATAGTAVASQAGLYSVTITNLITGCTAMATATVVSNTAAPVVSIGASAPGFGCGVTSVTLTANVPAGATYKWEDDSSTPTRTLSQTGTYGLSATATNSCSATATPVTLRQGNNNLPDVTMVFANNVTVVAGAGTATITVPSTPGQQFQVFGGSGSSYEYGSVLDRINGYQISQIDFSTNGIFTINRSGPFTITVRDATGCSRTVQGVIVVR
jgi:predicted outer membrane repeat protein